METTKVWGPPGTGKTRYALERAHEAIIDGKRWTYVTFSRATRLDTLDRFAQSTGYQRKDLSANIRTLHSLAYEAAWRSPHGEEKLLMGKDRVDFCQEMHVWYKPPAYDTNEDLAFVSARAEGPGAKFFAGLDLCRQIFKDPAVPANLRAAGGGGIPADAYDHLAGLVTKWAAWKTARKLWEQTDNLELALENGSPFSGDVLILDEAQDLTPLGWKWFDEVARDYKEVHIIGDDDQCLYRFSGASAPLFLNRLADRSKTLDRSYRIPRAVHQYAHAVIRSVSERQPKTFAPRGEEGRVARLSAEGAALVVRQEAYAGRTVLVLARTNYRLGHWATALTEAGVPHTALRGHTVWDGRLYPAANACIKLKLGGDLSRVEALALVDLLPRLNILRVGARTALRREKVGHYYNQEVISWFIGHKVPRPEQLVTSHKAGLVKYAERGTVLPIGRVRIGTYHAAKGLQADVVIVDTKLTSNIIDQCQAHRPTRDDEYRAAYVACTRALQSLYIVPSINGIIR